MTSPVQMPSAPCVQVSPDISIQTPLSRRGRGPGLVIVVTAALDLGGHEKTLDPPPLKKWAEEGFAVAQVVHLGGEAGGSLSGKLQTAFAELKKLEECKGDKFGVIVVQDGESSNAAVLDILDACPSIAGAVFYGGAPTRQPSTPALAHLPGTGGREGEPASFDKVTCYRYPSAAPFFSIPAHDDYRASAAAVAHTRSLSFLKPLVNGPFFDLEAIWDEHTRLEFADRSVEATMATMVDQPYVNHVPTLTGGIGRPNLTAFYRDHFIFSNPDDAGLELVSRTVGIDRVVDEFLFNCTHDRELDWLIPGIPPTGKPLSIPFTSVVNIRGDRLYHEHISWDQGTVLRQLGLLPEYLPFPYPVPGADPSRRFEYRVPVAGVESARKLIDETAAPSNEMLGFRVREI